MGKKTAPKKWAKKKQWSGTNNYIVNITMRLRMHEFGTFARDITTDMLVKMKHSMQTNRERINNLI